MIQEIKCLDKGFVLFKSMLDGDLGVCEAARVSYKSEAKTEEDNRKLIKYLIAHKHGTPLEHAVFKFHVKAPLFVARQWFRHRMASYNETSFRYREAVEEFYIPEKWRAQDTKNKQGSVESVDFESEQDRFHGELGYALDKCVQAYRALIRDGVAREMARMVLPVNLYTEFYWTVNARSLMNFVELRSDSHAQWEIRQYSHAMAAFFAEKMPWTWAAFSDNLKTNAGYDEMFKYLDPQLSVFR